MADLLAASRTIIALSANLAFMAGSPPVVNASCKSEQKRADSSESTPKLSSPSPSQAGVGSNSVTMPFTKSLNRISDQRPHLPWKISVPFSPTKTTAGVGCAHYCCPQLSPIIRKGNLIVRKSGPQLHLPTGGCVAHNLHFLAIHRSNPGIDLPNVDPNPPEILPHKPL